MRTPVLCFLHVFQFSLSDSNNTSYL